MQENTMRTDSRSVGWAVRFCFIGFGRQTLNNHSSAKIKTAITITAVLAIIALAAVHAYYNDPVRLFASRSGMVPANHGCSVVYPFNESIFPPELPSPAFAWRDQAPGVKRWVAGIFLGDTLHPICDTSVARSPWRPSAELWEEIKRCGMGKQVRFRVVGVSGIVLPRVTCSATAQFSISSDSVKAPIFYREVNLPFAEAVKDPSKIRWRFGSISSPDGPPVVLEHLPVCGNCHSFSANGSVVGMDVDYANDKGSYAIAAVEKHIVLDKKKILTWMDFKREDGKFTYGLLSRVSPSGRWVISTVKDRSVFVPRPDIAFSQLFFPVKGVLAVYTPETRSFASLPGADDTAFVQSNPVWSPDEKTVFFIRAPAYELKTSRNGVLLSESECGEFTKGGKPFKYDIYMVPFDKGKGGPPRPLKGASGNGMSNYFPVCSPDGKWVVFCRAANFSLLQPDSRLYILPVGGGTPRIMRCNRSTMNSWHSFSPDGRWMVFSSKEFSPYTQLFLTHIDSSGMDAPPVLLEHFTTPGRAANIPEFVNAPAGSIETIKEQFLDDMSFVRAAQEPLSQGDLSMAISRYKTALRINSGNASAHYNLAYAYEEQGDAAAAREQYLLALKADSTFAPAYNNAALILLQEHDTVKAQRLLERAIALQPDYGDSHFNYGVLLQQKKRLAEAVGHFTIALQSNPGWVQAFERLGETRLAQGKTDLAVQAFSSAYALDSTSEIAKKGLASIKR